MEHTKITLLNRFLNERVEISIVDDEGKDQPPFMQKLIQKFELCPDETHVRMFFDQKNFLAIPLSAKFQIDENKWSASDKDSNLTYIVQKLS